MQRNLIQQKAAEFIKICEYRLVGDFFISDKNWDSFICKNYIKMFLFCIAFFSVAIGKHYKTLK